MENKQEVFKNLAGLVLTTGVAIATGGSSVLALEIVNLMSSGLAGTFIGKTSYGEIKKLIQGVDPSDLNHDLQKLIAQAVEFAVRNIDVLYSKQLDQETHKSELKIFMTDLVSEIKLLEHIIKEKDDSIYKIIERKGNSHEVFKTFDINTENFPIINPDNPFNTFFEEQFKPNLELAFSELIKSVKNRPALIAYQRAVYQNLSQDIGKIINQNEQILQKLDVNEKKNYKLENDELIQIQTRIQKTNLNEPSDEFMKSIELRHDEILKKTAQIQTDISIIKILVKEVGKEVQVKWVPKEKALAFSILAVLGLIAAFFYYQYWSEPFNSNVALKVDPETKIHQNYPKLSESATIRFYLPSETKEKEVTFSNEIILSEIPKKMNNQKIKAELIDRYWKLKQDSITVKGGNIVITRIPNESLSVVHGIIKSRDGVKLLERVLVTTDTLETYTDALGKFSFDIPTHLRRIQYVIRMEKEGYDTAELEYYAGSEKEIRLNPI